MNESKVTKIEKTKNRAKEEKWFYDVRQDLKQMGVVDERERKRMAFEENSSRGRKSTSRGREREWEETGGGGGTHVLFEIGGGVNWAINKSKGTGPQK